MFLGIIQNTIGALPYTLLISANARQPKELLICFLKELNLFGKSFQAPGKSGMSVEKRNHLSSGDVYVFTCRKGRVGFQ